MQPQSIPLAPFQNFSNIRGDIRKSSCTTDQRQRWQISPRMFDKIRNGPNGILRGLPCRTVQISEYFRFSVGTFLPAMRDIKISEYFRARVETVLPDMWKNANIGIFQGSYGNIPS
jgi:hypothetical protein